MGSLKQNFYNANHAFNFLWDYIVDNGENFDNTKAIFNCGFYIHNPLENTIDVDFREWNKEYANAEWLWYLSGDPNIKKLGKIYGKIPPIWKRMADSRGLVNSNYGWQWQRKDQLAIHFHIIKDKVCMSVMMRSNDLWYGFCNDQYCFSKLQELVAKKLKLPLGWYYHYASNMHIYNDKLPKTK
jgi:thymidylate synthase